MDKIKNCCHTLLEPVIFFLEDSNKIAAILFFNTINLSLKVTSFFSLILRHCHFKEKCQMFICFNVYMVKNEFFCITVNKFYFEANSSLKSINLKLVIQKIS